METGDDACCTAGEEEAGRALLAEFRAWLDRERGLSPVSVRCYSKQAKAFLAAIGGPGAVSRLDAAGVTAFMVDHTRDRNTWSAKAMVTSLRAFLRFAHATGRTAVPLAGAVPAVASWRLQRISIGTFTGPGGTFRQRTDTPKPTRDLLTLTALKSTFPARSTSSPRPKPDQSPFRRAAALETRPAASQPSVSQGQHAYPVL